MKHKKSLLLFAILAVASCSSLIISNLVSAVPKPIKQHDTDPPQSTQTNPNKNKEDKKGQGKKPVDANEKKDEKNETQPTTPNASTGIKGNNGCGTDTSIIKCDPGSDENPIINLLQQAVKVLYGVIGVLAVVVIMIAGVIYGTAGDREDRVKLAKTMITNTIIGILLYVFMTVILNFLVPGGVF